MAIQVPPDSTGKLVETNSPDGTTQRQVVTVGDKTTAANVLGVDASGRITVILASGTTAVTQATGTNLHTVLDSGTTAVTQATGTNLHTVVDSGSITVTQATAANLKVDLSGTAANATALKVDGSAVTQPIQVLGNGAVLHAQVAVIGTATQLASNACKRVCLKALVGNTINVYVGSSSGMTTSTGFELAPGDFLTLDVTNTNLIWHIASTTGASISWVATN